VKIRGICSRHLVGILPPGILPMQARSPHCDVDEGFGVHGSLLVLDCCCGRCGFSTLQPKHLSSTRSDTTKAKWLWNSVQAVCQQRELAVALLCTMYSINQLGRICYTTNITTLSNCKLTDRFIIKLLKTQNSRLNATLESKNLSLRLGIEPRSPAL
jgi:hypothetical protein